MNAEELISRATIHRPLSERELQIVQCAVKFGLIGSSNAKQSLKEQLLDRERTIVEGPAGTRLENILRRTRECSERLDSLKAAKDEAETRHFDSLGGDDDQAITGARQAVLEAESQLRLAEVEVESMAQHALEARATLGAAFNTDQPQLWRELFEGGVEQRDDALAAISDALDGGLFEQFEKLAYALDLLNLVTTDANGFRANCSIHGLSEKYRQLVSAGHVSLGSDRVKKLERHLVDGLRVRV